MIHPIQSASLDTMADRIPAGTPVHMLNLLRFRPGGRNSYFGSYVDAFRTILTDMGIEGVQPIWAGDVAGFVAGPDGEAWDAVLIVRYPSLAAFRAIVESDRYRDEALPHRLSAVSDWRLIAQTEMPRPA
jgi:hypothetical protein